METLCAIVLIYHIYIVYVLNILQIYFPKTRKTQFFLTYLEIYILITFLIVSMIILL